MTTFNDDFDAHTLTDPLRDHAEWGTVNLDANSDAEIIADQFGRGGNSVDLDAPGGTNMGVAYAYQSGTTAVFPSTGDIRISATVKWAGDAESQALMLFARTILPDAEEDTDLVGVEDLKNAYLVGLYRGTEANPMLAIIRTNNIGTGSSRIVLASKFLSTAEVTGGGTIQMEVVGNFIRAWWKASSFDYDFSSDVPDLVVYDFGVAKDRIGTWGFTWLTPSNHMYIDDFSATDITPVFPNTPALDAPTFPQTSTTVPVSLSFTFSHPTPGKVHTATRWQIDTTGGSFNPAAVYDAIDTVNLAIKVFHVPEATTLKFRCAVQDEDGNWSAFSTAQEFTTPSWSTGTVLAPYPLPSASFPASLLPNVDQGFSDSYMYRNLKFEGDKGADRSVAKWDDPKRVFTISYTYLTPTQKNTLRDFWINRKGSHLSFTFVHPIDGTSHAVKFMDKTADFEAWFNTVYNTGLRMIESWDPPQSGIYT